MDCLSCCTVNSLIDGCDCFLRCQDTNVMHNPDLVIFNLLEVNKTLWNFLFRFKISEETLAHYGLVVDGLTLKIALLNYETLFREVALGCATVLCCRLSPKQKAEVCCSYQFFKSSVCLISFLYKYLNSFVFFTLIILPYYLNLFNLQSVNLGFVDYQT